jgi:hypothetical protein
MLSLLNCFYIINNKEGVNKNAMFYKQRKYSISKENPFSLFFIFFSLLSLYKYGPTLYLSYDTGTK